MTEHQEFRQLRPGSDTAVIFTHGILGSPCQFVELLPLAAANSTVVNLLLPGHGGSGRDFAKSSVQDWQAYLDAEIAVLRRNHSRILIVGHSLGGLLALESAVTFADCVRGLFLLAPALCPRLSWSSLSMSAQVVLRRPSPQDSPHIAAARRIYSVEQRFGVGYLAFLPQFRQLLQKARNVRQYSPTLQLPFWAVFCRRDESVSLRSCAYLPPQTRLTILEQSGHYHFSPADQQQLQALFADFLEQPYWQA